MVQRIGSPAKGGMLPNLGIAVLCHVLWGTFDLT